MTTKNKWFAGLLFGSIVVIVVVAFIMWYYVEGSSWWLNATFVATCLILAAIFVWLLILVAKVGFAYLAEVDCLVTYVREGQFKYLMNGEVLERILYRLRDHYVDQETGDVLAYADLATQEERDEKRQIHDKTTWFEKLFGVYWVGLPPKKILKYQFVRERFERPDDRAKEDDDPNYQLVNDRWRVVRRDDYTNYLAFQHNYPLLAMSLETKSQLEVNIVGIMTIQVTNAYRPIMLLEGRWFEKAKDAASGALNELTKENELAEFRVMEKVKSLATRVKGTKRQLKDVGVAISAYTFSDWESSDPQIEGAARASELARLQGEGILKTADAEASAIRVKGDATAAAAKALVDASKDAPDITKTKLLSDAIGKHNGTLVIGNQTPLLLGDNQSPNPSGANTPPNTP